MRLVVVNRGDGRDSSGSGRGQGQHRSVLQDLLEYVDNHVGGVVWVVMELQVMSIPELWESVAR